MLDLEGLPWDQVIKGRANLFYPLELLSKILMYKAHMQVQQ
jgi:hypothetical protein